MVRGKLAKKGVRQKLRISDGRMSGMGGGSIGLHISSEPADPSSVLGVTQDGAIITCDLEECLLRVEIPDDGIRRRLLEVKLSLRGAGR